MTHGEAFKLAMKAVRHFGWYRPVEAMQALPRSVQAGIESCGGFKALCDMPVANRQILAGQFRKAYEEKQKQLASQRKLPEEFRPKLQSEQYQQKLTNQIKNIGVMK